MLYSLALPSTRGIPLLLLTTLSRISAIYYLLSFVLFLVLSPIYLIDMSRTVSGYNDNEIMPMDDRESPYGDFTGIPDASSATTNASETNTDEGENPDIQRGGIR